MLSKYNKSGVNLVVDQGNSFNKLAVFDREAILFSESTASTDEQSLASLLNKYPIQRAILSSVRTDGDELFQLIKKFVPSTIFFDSSTKLPFKNSYQTPKTIGKDRLAAVAGAITLYPHCNILIVDAGTAITFEWVNKQGEYQGGNISPGLYTRFRALNHFTSQLPFCEPDASERFIGNTTQSAIVAGVQNGLIFEIEGYIRHFKQEHPDLKVVMTGGDAEFFAGKVKNPIFVSLNLVLTGLNRILEYNV